MEGLREKAISGAFWTSIQKFGISILSFLSNIVLARLLVPDDYGCIGLLAIFIAISNSLVFGGFISALIQKKDAAEPDYSTVFIWNLSVAIILYLILFFVAPFIASFYRISKLCSVLRVEGLILIVNGLSTVQTTLLRKALRFKKLAIINIISSSIAIVVAIILAYKGMGVWALVTQQIVMSSCNTLLLWITSTWRPSCVFSIDSFRGLFSYGGFMLLSDLMNTFCDNIQGLIIGRRFSSSTMGYYAQAKRLEEVPTQSFSQLVAQVTFPIYSTIQDEHDRLRSAVKRTLSLMNYVNFPLMVLLMVVAEPLIVCLYSNKWIDSIPLFQILCVAGLVNCLQSVNYQVVSASGRSKQLFIWNFAKRGSGLLLMIIGAFWGVKGVLWGMVISYYIVYYVNARLAFQSTHYSIGEQALDSLPYLILSIVSAVLVFPISYMISQLFIRLVVQVFVFICSYALLSLFFAKNQFLEIRSIIGTYVKRFLVVNSQ